MERRPIKSRGAAWASLIAKVLADAGITPNQVSISSVIFALLSAISFYYSALVINPWPYFLLGAVFIQCRLLCNLMDGMVAIEHKKKTISGEVYNDLPDRIADLLIIVGVGYGVSAKFAAVELGYIAANVAVLTAYIRVLGGSLKTEQFFYGPMAKPHRMALITVCALIDMTLHLCSYSQTFSALYISLWIIVLGGLITCFRRLSKILKVLEERT